MSASALTRPGQRDRISEKLGEIDWRLAALLAFVTGIGAMMLYSIAGGHWGPWADAHLTRFFLLFGVMIVLSLIDLKIWYSLAYPVYILALVLLVATAVAGQTHLGGKRWLGVGHFTIQPSEIMKIALVMALGRFYHNCTAKQARWSWKLLIPAAMIGAPVLLVAKQPDLGTAIMLAVTGGVMMFMAGLTWKLLIAGFVAVSAAAVPIYMFLLKGFQKARIDVFLHPDRDPSGKGYHVIQAAIAAGSGGLLGKGYMLGSQSQLNYLPEKQTDFIFATVAEEFGFVGCFILLLAYGAIVAVGLRIASTSHSHFGRMTAAGVTAAFGLYVIINGAMVIGLAPVVGVPMPLMSYGGTVMVTVMIGMGLVQAVRVHRYSELPRGRGFL
ncbi:MAG TPA: rod shape-determining protein RodA [Caulobacteraceae bacterium]|jgi:rod shape determining protein RodA|nr:rod shape-determining protein RodA [Caulobacteraceae bacterium]